MSVKYVFTKRGNINAPQLPKKVYAQAKGDGEVTFKKLSKEIAEGSTTVSDSDVLAVLNDLTKCLRRHLSEGRIVRFGDFGAFQISISSGGSDTEEKFHASLIKGGRITFRPGIDLREMLNNLTFEKLK